MQIIKRKTSDVKIFSDTAGYDVLNQVRELAEYDAYKDSKIRIMPDCHVGAGCTIGTTMEINDKVTPNLVGVDIGCGMLTVKLKTKELDFKLLDDIINKYVPYGQNVHKNSIAKFPVESLRCYKSIPTNRALSSIGSLGGGNHFIEVSKDKDGSLYLIIHSGSRNLGLQVATYYQHVAWKNINEMSTIKKNLIAKLKAEGREKEIVEELKKIKKPKANKDLAHLESDDFINYMHDMDIMQQYASLNRKTMKDIILKHLNIQEESSFETIHNYIDFKRMILRKVSVSAEKGELLLIPINMHDGSLLCVGKGNEDWNYSAPHGAGRILSRSKAKELLDLDEFNEQMKDIYTTSVGRSTLDEAPGAYKSIEEIMDNIEDTVEVIDILVPLYNFKAH